MPISRSNCLFVHIPKCAGTSVEVALGIADEYPAIGVTPTHTEPDFSKLFGGGLQHLTIREIIKNYTVNLYNSYTYSFSIIRDPVDRFVSYFLWKYYKFSEYTSGLDRFIGEIWDEIDSIIIFSKNFAMFKDPFVGFEYCQADTDPLPPNDIRRHLLPQCSYIFYDAKVPIEAVYPIEKVEHLPAELLRRSVTVEAIPHRMVGGMSRQLRNMLPQSAEHAIRDVYRFDARLHAYILEATRRDGDCKVPGSALIPDIFEDSARTLALRHNATFTFPRQIWIYWHQGWRFAPPIAQKCVASWRIRNPTWTINLLDSNSLDRVVQLPEFYGKLPNIPMPALSDIVRIHILAEHGGIWADATTWCARSLDEWLTKVVVKTGFFAYANPAPGRPISTWFLAALPHHAIVQRLKVATDNLWRSIAEQQVKVQITDDPNSRDYFWFHRLFACLLEEDEHVADTWHSGTQISADAPHYLQLVGLLNSVCKGVEFHIRNRLSNIYKLTRRIDIPDSLDGSVLGLLLSTLNMDDERILHHYAQASAGSPHDTE